MIAVLQRVKEASVTVDGVITGACGKGLSILLGVAEGDSENDVSVLAQKIAKLRIFTDAEDKMNLSLLDIGGEALVVSNFTLLADYHHGNRPNFMYAAKPEIANPLYEKFSAELSALLGKKVGNGVFGAEMTLNIVGDGPVTIVMDSKVLLRSKERTTP